MATAKKTSVSVQVMELSIKHVSIPIVGISPLIVHAWSKKAKQMIIDKQAQVAKNKKHEVRNPQDDFESAKHKAVDGWEGFPAAAFKAAMIRGAKTIGMVMSDTRAGFFIQADCQETQLVKIKGKCKMRDDMVTVHMGSADIRYRPEYWPWSVVLNIEYNAGMLSLDQLHQLVKAGGHGCGIGEMRPQSTNFNFGRFKLANEK